jgi:hypothetical protein
MAPTTINVNIISINVSLNISDEISETSNSTIEKSSTSQTNIELNEDTINNIIANYLENNGNLNIVNDTLNLSTLTISNELIFD